MVSSMLALVNAQVKGHSYYALEGYMAGQDVELLLEVENDGRLALGQIKYQNGESPIRLFGHRDRQDANTLLLEEHLDNGQWTGSLSLNIENGAVKTGEWRSASDDSVYPLNISKVKSFPFNKVRSFFHPASIDSMKGHFISYIRQGKAIREDRALNIVPSGDKAGFFSIELSAKTLFMGSYEQMGENEFMFTSINETTIGVKVFDDFAEVSVIMAENDNEEIKAEAFYVKEQGVQEITTWSFTGGELFSVRGRLEHGHPVLVVSKNRMLEENKYVDSFATLKSGRHELNNVQGNVIDMVIGSIGMDINPVLCLLLEDHTIQILSLTNFRQTGVTTVSDPLPNITDVQKILEYDPNYKPSEDDEFAEGADELWAINSKGESTPFTLSYDTGDYMLNPKNSIDCDAYLSMSELWGIHLIMKEDGKEYSYFGQYWVINHNYENGDKVIGYRMTQKRLNEGDMIQEPCMIEGSFQFSRDPDNWTDLIITPLEGLKFTPKGKTVKFTYMEAVG